MYQLYLFAWLKDHPNQIASRFYRLASQCGNKELAAYRTLVRYKR